MSDTEVNRVLALNVTTTPTLNALYQHVREEDVINIVSDITPSNNNLTIIIDLQSLVRRSADRQYSTAEDSADRKIRELSEKYKKKYKELLNHLKEWQPRRQELLKILETSLYNMKRNASFVSGFRILTSLADIWGTLQQSKNSSDNLFANTAIEYAPFCGLVAFLIEKSLSKLIQANIINAVEEDQKSFIKIEQWFKQTKELDDAVRNFFPYGIDKDEVRKIHACYENIDDFQKIFFAVLSSNVKQNVRLFKNEEFLERADCFSTSEIGKIWFQMVLSEHPCNLHIINSSLREEMEHVQTESQTESPELCAELFRVWPSIIKLKVILNAFIIISCATNLYSGVKLSECLSLEKILESARKELQEVKSIVNLLNPSGSMNEPISET